MITLKEYEIYLKVKKFIETKNCDENNIIPKLTVLESSPLTFH